MSTDNPKSNPARDETSSNTSHLGNNPTPAANDDESLQQSSDPNAKEIQQAQAEVTPKTGDPETLKPSSPTHADSHIPEKTSSSTTPSFPATKNGLIQATGETGDTEPCKQDFAAVAGPHVQEITPVEKDTKADDIGGLRKNPTADVDADADPDPRTQQMAPEDETVPKDSNPPSNPHAHSKTSKRPSLWKKFGNICFFKVKRSSSKISDGTPGSKSPTISKRSDGTTDSKGPTTSTSPEGKESSHKTEADLECSQKEAEHDLECIRKEAENHLDYIKRRVENLEQYLKQLKSEYEKASTKFKKSKSNLKDEKYLKELRNAIIKLKLQVNSDEKDDHNILTFDLKPMQDSQEKLHELAQLHGNPVFKRSLEFKDFKARYNELSTELQLCLLCFSIFPEDAIIKKRLMLQWWTCEGFAAKKEDAEVYFNQLMEKGFIEPVNKNKSRSVGECQMHPYYRSALAMLAKGAMFFNFDSKGQPTQNFLGSFQACLVGDGVISYEEVKCEVEKRGGLENAVLDNVLEETLERVHLLVNVKEGKVDFKPGWFSMMKNVNFLHLGNWRSTDHVEVESMEFLEKVGNMDYLKYLSLQGVANVTSLPKSISKFANLEILDLRACHNLDTIPDNIGDLGSLTHLDMSGCSLLEHMPKRLCNLKKLKVLKGFVVSNHSHSCTLDDLSKLQELEKLCIYTGLREFPADIHVKALRKFQNLRKLTITWAVTDSKPPKPSESSQGSSALPSTLTKLDLKCFPMSTTPYWLNLQNLKQLKKLYIRGGKFSDLGQYQDTDDWELVWPGKKHTWDVTELRLKFLSEVELEWTQFQKLFPLLEYLEQVDCPKLTFFPCDANGVWINK